MGGRTWACALVMLATACGGGSGGTRMNTEIQRGPMPSGGTWAGVWFTNWGNMSLSTRGSSVVGQFCDEDRNRYGRFEGTAQGDVLTFHWVTTDVTMAGSPRTTEGSGIVQFSFVPAGEARGMRFEGTWGFGAANAGGGPIRGDRSSRYSEPFLRGSYRPECSIRDEATAPPPLSREDAPDNPDDGVGGGDFDF